MDRTTFLDRVRNAAHNGRAYRVHTQPIPPGTGYVGTTTDRCAHFSAEANAVGGEAIVVEGHTAAREALAELLEIYAVRSSLVWQHPVLDRLEISALLATKNVSIDDFSSLSNLSPAEQRTRVLGLNIGITSCDSAIAETGTLVMLHRPGHERMTSLVPPVHVAIVEESQILPDLFDVFAQLQLPSAGPLPSNITLITGPSKTGDIELQLTTGVHGPKHWHLIVIRS
jgi:L-lactate dehydrogenase complex protein LldG